MGEKTMESKAKTKNGIKRSFLRNSDIAGNNIFIKYIYAFKLLHTDS